jgi:DNA polymerase
MGRRKPPAKARTDEATDLTHTRLHIDFETCSAADLTACGVHKYAQHLTTMVHMMAYQFEGGPRKIWFMWGDFPQEVLEHVLAGGTVVAHNAAFERVLWNVVLMRQVRPGGLPLPRLTIKQMDCTMARAAALGLPGGLDYVAEVMEVENRKDAVGKKLMLKYCQPKAKHQLADGTATYEWWHDGPQADEDMRREGEYCLQDVATEADIDRVLLPLSARERRVWELDQEINDRGIQLDLKLVEAAIGVVEVAGARLHTRMAELTGNAVENCDQVQKLVAWINSRGIPCTSIAKGVQDELLIAAEGIDDKAVIEAIDLRRQCGKGTPTSKFLSMVECACEDDKARGQLNYHGATTGRWTGRLIQFQNLPGVDEERDGANVAAALAVLACDWMTAEAKADAIAFVCGSILPVLSRCLRAMVVASPGCRFVGGDLSNIEGCVAAWLVDEDWKVEAYREYQAGRGDDLYKIAYSRAFGVAVEKVSKAQRQVGKVQELSCSYQGSVGAFVGMCRNYGVKPDTMVPAIRGAATDEAWAAANAAMKRPGTRRFNLSEDTWTALKVAITLWRDSHPAMVPAWYELQDSAIRAVENTDEFDEHGNLTRPAEVVWCLNNRIAYVHTRQVLWCLLPSGRTLAYHKPRIKGYFEYQVIDADGRTTWADEHETEKLIKAGCCRTDAAPRSKRKVIFEEYDSLKKRWLVNYDGLYGGLQFENVVQAIARDVMVEGMFAAEDRGYPIVLTVHDELLCDVPEGHGSAEELREIMATVPAWCPGLPLAAKTWEGQRYEK